MRNKNWLGVLAACAASSGCSVPWHELQNATGDRLWLISVDRTVIVRCIDSTPTTKPQSGPIEVYCQEAYMRGPVEPSAVMVK